MSDQGPSAIHDFVDESRAILDQLSDSIKAGDLIQAVFWYQRIEAIIGEWDDVFIGGANRQALLRTGARAK